MLTKFLLRRTAALWLTGLLVMALTLTACGGATGSESETPAGSNQTTPESQPEVAEEVEEPQETEAQKSASSEEEPAAEATESADNENLLAPDQPLPEAVSVEAACHTVDIPENPFIAQVSDSDWVKGPADAPITVIEYGDFQ